MGLPYLTNCWCLSLRTATIIIGFLYVGIGLLYSVAFLEMAMRYENKYESITTHDADYRGFLRELSYLYSDAMQTVFSLSLLYGAFKADPYKRCYMLPWIIFHCQEAFNLASHVLCFRSHFFYLIEELLVYGSYAGFIFVVASYYHSLPKQKYLSS